MRKILLFILLFIAVGADAQYINRDNYTNWVGRMGIGKLGIPNPNVLLELGDTNTSKSMLLARVRNTQLIQQPAEGMFHYDMSNGKLYFRNGFQWLPLLDSTYYREPTAADGNYYTDAVTFDTSGMLVTNRVGLTPLSTNLFETLDARYLTQLGFGDSISAQEPLFFDGNFFGGAGDSTEPITFIANLNDGNNYPDALFIDSTTGDLSIDRVGLEPITTNVFAALDSRYLKASQYVQYNDSLLGTDTIYMYGGFFKGEGTLDYPVTLIADPFSPTDVQFIVNAGATITPGTNSITLQGSLDYAVEVYRGAVSQTSVDKGDGYYYTKDPNSELITFYPALAQGEAIRIHLYSPVGTITPIYNQ